MMSAATVWLMKVATTAIKAAKTHITPYKLRSSTRSVIASAMACNKPELFTAFPSARPPAARIMIVQRKLLKSSLVSIPVPKKRTIGMMAMTPISPNTPSSWWLIHQSAIVASVTKEMKYWIPVNLSFIGRMGTIVVFLPGWKVMRSSTQIMRMVRIQTGKATKNQIPHPGGGAMFCNAMRFCGEAIGDAAPPMFEDRAIPRSRALVMLLSDGRLRRMGYVDY